MDCEKLILLVHERKYLWDQREGNYHMRNVQANLWKEVSTEMKLPVEEIRKRWRGLRDTFRKEFMKHMKIKTGSGGNESQSSWPFFKQLSFLIDTMKPRKMESSVPSIDSDDMSITDEGDESCNLENFADLGQTGLPSTSQASESVESQQASTTPSAKKLFKSPPKKKIRSRDELSKFDEQLLEIERSKVKYLEEKTIRTQDEDYQFLMSLLPHLHDIPKSRKLLVRKKIMDVVLDESTPNTSSHSTPNYSSDDSSGVLHNTSAYYQNFDPTGY